MSKPSILLADDEPLFLEGLSIILSDNFQIHKASDGLEALDIIQRNDDISLVLLDLEMPKMNGVEFLQRIRDAKKNVSVTVLTGKSTHENAKKCADLNVQGYLDKVIDVEELIDRIKKVLDMEKRDC